MPKSPFVHTALISAKAICVLLEELADFGGRIERRAVIAGENDEGIFINAEFAEGVDQFADIGVDAGHLRGVGFLFHGPRLVLVDAKVIDFMGAVGEGDGVKHHEGIFGISFHPLDHFILNQFLGVGFSNSFAGVSGKAYRSIIIVKVSGEVGMSVPLAVVAEESVDALLVRTSASVKESHAPFPKGRGGISSSLGDFTDGDGFGRDGPLSFGSHFAVATDGAFPGVKSGEENGATRGANARAAVGLHVAGAFLGELVNARSLD